MRNADSFHFHRFEPAVVKGDLSRQDFGGCGFPARSAPFVGVGTTSEGASTSSRRSGQSRRVGRVCQRGPSQKTSPESTTSVPRKPAAPSSLSIISSVCLRTHQRPLCGSRRLSTALDVLCLARYFVVRDHSEDASTRPSFGRSPLGFLSPASLRIHPRRLAFGIL